MLTHVLPPISTSRFSHLCRALPGGSHSLTAASRLFRPCRSSQSLHCISLAPARLDRYPRGFTGHVARPTRSIQPFNASTNHVREAFLAIRSMSAIGIVCHWNLVPPAATRFQSSIIIAVTVLLHRRQFRRGPLMRNTCSKLLLWEWWC